MSHPTRPKVLCVDDEPALLRSLRWLLRSEFEVVVSSDPVQALTLLDADCFDVVVSDQRMPGMTGTEFLHKAMRKAPQTTRLLLTGYADFSAVVAALNDGNVFRYINKPWDNAKLIHAVQEGARLSRMNRPEWGDFQDTPVQTQTDRSTGHEEVLLVHADASLKRSCTTACNGMAQLLVADDPADALTLLAQRDIAVVMVCPRPEAGSLMPLVQAFRRCKPRLAVAVCSDRQDIATLQTMINDNLIHHFVALPAEVDRLRQCVAAALQRHRDQLARSRRLPSLQPYRRPRRLGSAESAMKGKPPLPMPRGPSLPHQWIRSVGRWLLGRR